MALRLAQASSETTFGPTRGRLLFLHGRLCHSEMWRPLIQSLGKHFPTSWIEFPGFDKTQKDLARALSLDDMAHIVVRMVSKLPATRIVLVGHDIGGSVALLCAKLKQELFAGLVLINPCSILELPPEPPLGLFASAIGFRLSRLLKTQVTLPGDHKLKLTQMLNSRQSRKNWLEALVMIQEAWPNAFERVVLRRELRSLSLPVLMLWGKHDAFNSKASCHELVRELPDADYFEHEGCGHWPCLEDTGWVSHKLKEFLFRVNYSRELDEPMSYRRSLSR